MAALAVPDFQVSEMAKFSSSETCAIAKNALILYLMNNGTYYYCHYLAHNLNCIANDWFWNLSAMLPTVADSRS